MHPRLRVHRRSESQLLRPCAESSAWLREAASGSARRLAERIARVSPARARVSTTVNGHHCVRPPCELRGQAALCVCVCVCTAAATATVARVSARCRERNKTKTKKKKDKNKKKQTISHRSASIAAGTITRAHR